MEYSYDFFSSILWRYLALGIAGCIGFSIIISQLKMEQDAQTPERQSAAKVLVTISWIISTVLIGLIFMFIGISGGIAAILLAPLVAGIFASLAKISNSHQ